MPLVVTISGLHGTGKSTYAKTLAEEFKLRYVSAGQLFRDIAKEKGVSMERLIQITANDPEIDHLIDERTKREAEKGDVILEGQLAGWMAKDKGGLKIFLTAPEDVRIKRIAERDSVGFEKAKAQTVLRDKAEREKYKKYYDIDITDISIYDLIMDTSLLSLEESIKILKNMISDYIARQPRR